MAGNVLLGGVIGAVVDSNTGAMLNLSPNPLKIVLSPIVESTEPVDETSVESVTASSGGPGEANSSADSADGDGDQKKLPTQSESEP